LNAAAGEIFVVAVLVLDTPDDTPVPREAAARSESDVMSPDARSLSGWYVRYATSESALIFRVSR